MKPKSAIRRSQLITTFGPGAMLDLPRVSVLVAGLEHWVGRGEPIVEPRLARKLAAVLGLEAVELRSPPLPPELRGSEHRGVKAFRFPEWFLTQQSNYLGGDGVRSRLLLHRTRLEQGRFRDEDGKLQPVTPVRFVRACRAGHIDDIDWYDFVHRGAADDCKRAGRQLYLNEHGISSALSEESVRCDCGARRNIVEAAITDSHPLGICKGKRLWLGPASREACQFPFRLLIRSASNAYFAQTLSVISLPDRGQRVRAAVDAAWEDMQAATTRELLRHEMSKPRLKEAFKGISGDEVWAELQRRLSGSNGEQAPIKMAELETLMTARADEQNAIFSAQVLPREAWDQTWMQPIERVVLVHRLREVVAQVGFTRFEPIAPDIQGELDLGVLRAALATETTWLPAFENRGEGIFVQFNRQTVAAWTERPAVAKRALVLLEAWKAQQQGQHGPERDFPGMPYLLLHSFAHLLLTALSLRCGYPASSIRERVYAADELGYGILLYTGAPDAEGTLGGLVEAGRDIAPLVQDALELGRLCSNDPICAQRDPAREPASRSLHGAACHGCLLIAETSCEQHNNFLDRGLVVATIEKLGLEMFPERTAGLGADV